MAWQPGWQQPGSESSYLELVARSTDCKLEETGEAVYSQNLPSEALPPARLKAKPPQTTPSSKDRVFTGPSLGDCHILGWKCFSGGIR